MRLNQSLYWRLSGFYFAYFAIVGAMMPYWSIYLQSLSYDAVQIGTVTAIIMGTKIIAPNIWGWLADHSGRRMFIVRVASLLTLLSFVLIFWVEQYWQMIVLMLVFSFFWNANLPQFEAETLSHLGEKSSRYSAIRSWGSMGFIFAVVVLGILMEQFGTQSLLYWMIATLLIGWIISLSTPAADRRDEPHNSLSLWSVLKQPSVIALFVVCFLLQASHGPYYTFYSIYLESYGYSRSLIGQLWALGVICEILLFLSMHRLFARFSPRLLMTVALALSALRWVLIAGFPEDFWIIVFAQTLHAASFGLYHAVAIYLVHGYFRGKLQGRGQGLYSSLSFGAGGAVGAFISGYYWEQAGPAVCFTLAALSCVVAMIICWLYLHQAPTQTASQY